MSIPSVLGEVADLTKRYREIWDYDAQPKERGLYCNLCGQSWPSDGEVQFDRYGYRVHVVTCPCGLVFLNRRMKKEAYARFYETAYRPLVSAFHGREINAQTIQPEQRVYAGMLANILDHWVTEPDGVLLDIGGSTGIVASVLQDRLGLTHACVIDPNPSELVHARKFTTYRGTIETFGSPDDTFRYDLVTLCQTADHLLDLMGSLKKIKSLLSDGGLFWSDIVDFDVTREVKIDHPFNLTERTYREFLKRAGFKLLQVNYAPDGVHVGFLARAAE